MRMCQIQRNIRFAAAFILVLGVGGFVYYSNQKQSVQPAAITEQEVLNQLSSMPLVFQRNDGQVDGQVKYFVRLGTQSIFFTTDSIVYSFIKSASDDENAEKPKTRRGLALEQTFVGSNTSSTLASGKELESKVNYFIGNDPDKWQTQIPTFSSVLYQDLYQGIDVKYSGETGRLKYEYILDPNVSPEIIRVQFDGMKGYAIADTGDLVVDTEFGPFGVAKPAAYQWVNDQKVMVSAAYRILDDRGYGFTVGAYDRSLPLIIAQ